MGKPRPRSLEEAVYLGMLIFKKSGRWYKIAVFKQFFRCFKKLFNKELNATVLEKTLTHVS